MLSRVNIDDDSVDDIKQDIDEIILFSSIVKEFCYENSVVDCTSPLISPSENMYNRLRRDIVMPGNFKNIFLKNSPKEKNGEIMVPEVI